MSNLSEKQIFGTLPAKEQEKRLNLLTNKEAEILFYDAKFNARPNQLAPLTDYYFWIVNAGRGFGKTKIGSWWVLDNVYNHGHKDIILVGATQTDLERIMINGDSGIINSANKYQRPEYVKSEGILYFYDDATKKDRKVIAKAVCLSAQEPDRARGLQCSLLWFDEFAAYPYLQAIYDMLVMGHRLTGRNGEQPKGLITTTPRPLKFFKKLIKDKRNIVTSGNTFDNAENLAKTFLETIKSDYAGTRLGLQEIEGVILDDNPNALFSQDTIHKYRVPKLNDLGEEIEYIYSSIVVAIDPAVTANATSDLTGIVVAGKGVDGHYYVIEDLSMKGKPHEWATVAAKAYYRHQANCIVAEVNNGGDMVGETINNIDINIPFTAVRASRGKIIRAEPIALLYEKGSVHHIGELKELEEELTGYTGDSKEKSPDRFDAAVWALSYLSDNNGFGLAEYAANKIKDIEEEREKTKEEESDNKRYGWL